MTVFYFIYMIFFGSLFFWCWSRSRDVFHPWIIFIPQFIFLYGFFPLPTVMAAPERFYAYAGEDALYWYQFLTIVLPLCLLLGIAQGAGQYFSGQRRAVLPQIANKEIIYRIAIGLGIAGVASWLYGIYNVGGFFAAYGAGYGGGWDDSGYVRELPYIGMLAVLMVFLLRVGKGMRAIDWALILFSASPVLLHGLLGARRGPTFMAAILVAGGYVFFMRKRVSLSIVLPAGIMLGMFILFLVANRDDIHLGSELTELKSPLSFLEQFESSEYLIGGAVVQYADKVGSFYGAREATHLLGRMTPKFIWPNVYADLGQMFGFVFDLTLNSGIDPSAIETITGWQPTVGSAMGMVGDFWIEFNIFSLAVAYAIGYFYGRVWRASFTNLTAKLMHLILSAFSIYLVMQDLDAWLYRVFLLGIPLVLAMRLVKVAPRSPFQRSVPVRG